MPIESVIDHLGEVRKLAYQPPSENTKLMRANMTNIQAVRQRAGLTPLIPRSEWKEKDFISPLGKKYINNQKSCGGCTGWSGAQGSMRNRGIRGFPFVKLSGASLYAQINGGHDNGSNIGDSMRAIEKQGVCLESEMNFPNIYPKQIPSNATWYQEATPITGATFDELVTGLQMNMLPQFPVDATSNWTRNRGFDQNGVADIRNTNSTNHSVHGAGLVNINGIWYIIMPNTWDITWGPWVSQNPPWYADFCSRNGIVPVDTQFPLAGCCLLSEDHINNGADQDDGYLHGDAHLSPSSSSGAAA